MSAGSPNKLFSDNNQQDEQYHARGRTGEVIRMLPGIGACGLPKYERMHGAPRSSRVRTDALLLFLAFHQGRRGRGVHCLEAFELAAGAGEPEA
jgi:hypothetical protein